jgi:hypothetical protein
MAKLRRLTMFNIDVGNSGGGEGPWLAWSARGTLDGSVEGKSFFIREGSTKTTFEGFKTGVVLDIKKMKTGWQRSEGVAGTAPDWKWNPSVSQMLPQPTEEYKKGFSIRCAIGGGGTATWEQAGASAWNSFINLVPELQKAPDADSLPLVRITGSKLEQFKRGSTVTPILEVVKWVPRPDCLKEGASGAFAVEPAPAPKPAPVAAPVALDDAEF